MSEADIVVDIRMATKGIRRFGEIMARAQTSIVRFGDALVDAGLSDPPPGYWTGRLAREIAWRSVRARIGRVVATVVAQTG